MKKIIETKLFLLSTISFLQQQQKRHIIKCSLFSNEHYVKTKNKKHSILTQISRVYNMTLKKRTFTEFPKSQASKIFFGYEHFSNHKRHKYFDTDASYFIPTKS
mmetsp:Transcript_9257/g.20455  ORF Transcript_9257/g.20455 Transcript_9257/m.20455 type:complete len:104 (+) Transcript_9257:1825-2136(+)